MIGRTHYDFDQIAVKTTVFVCFANRMFEVSETRVRMKSKSERGDRVDSREFRRKWLLTQEELAELLAMKRITIAQWEMKEGEGSGDRNSKLLSLLDTTFSFLDAIGEYPEIEKIYKKSREKRSE